MRTSLILLIVLAAGIGAFELKEGTTIAALPFANDTGQPERNWVGVGLAEVMQAMLTGIPGLTVVERINLEAILDEIDFQHTAYVGTNDAAAAGRLLGARVLVMGSFQLAADVYSVTCRAVDAESGEILAVSTASGPERELFALQKTMARDICNQIRVERIARNYLSVIDTFPIPGTEGLKLHSEGRMAAWEGRTEEAYLKFKEAIDRNPAFRGSFSGMNYSYEALLGGGLLNKFKEQKYFSDMQFAMVRSFFESAALCLYTIEPIKDMEMEIDPDDPSKGRVTIELRIGLNFTFRGELRKAFKKFEGGSLAIWPEQETGRRSSSRYSVFQPSHAYITARTGGIPRGFLAVTREACIVDDNGRTIAAAPLRLNMADYAWTTTAFILDGKPFEDGLTHTIRFTLTEAQMGQAAKFIIR